MFVWGVEKKEKGEGGGREEDRGRSRTGAVPCLQRNFYSEMFISLLFSFSEIYIVPRIQ